MRTRSRARARKAPTPAPQGAGEHSSTWGSLNFDLLAQVLNAVQRLGSEDGGSGAAGRAGGLQAVRAWAAVLGVNKHWRACAQELPLDACVPPSAALIGWLRHIKLRRLEFQHGASERGDALGCQGFAGSEQRYRAAISTLLATLDFIKASGASLQVLAGVHPREGILYLTPFQRLESISMTGCASETCRMAILAGLPRLRVVFGAGYGEYAVEGLPPSVRHVNLQWSLTPAASFAPVDFRVPEGCALDSLALSSQRPLCLGAEALARCASLRLSARRVYLGLPLRRGAPWADVDDLAARFAQFMLGGALESLEVTATRSFVFQPVAEAFDLASNEGLGGIAQHEQLATVLLARHFQSLHVEQRMLAVGAFRSFMRIAQRRAEPVAFSFSAPLHREQLDFLQQHALATSIAFGPTSQCDAAAVLNHGAFAERNGGLLRQLQHLELSSQLDLGPYTALQSLQGTWQSEPQLALGAAQLSSLRLTPPLGAQQAQRAFQSRWLRGVQQLGSLQLMRFATADLSHVRGAANITLGSMQPPGGLVSPESLALPADGFGPGCALALRMAYAPPHAIHAAAEGAQHMMAPGALAAALQQHAAAAAAAAEQAAAALNAAQQQQQQAQQAAGQQQPAPQQQQPPQQQQQQALGPPPDLIDLVSDDEDDGPPPLGPPLDGPPPQFAPALPAPAQQGLPAPWPPAAAAPGALPAAGAEGGLVLDSDDEDDDLPELMEDDEPPPPLGPPAFVNQQGGGLGPWVVVQAQQQGGPALLGPDFQQPWDMPDDRLSDVTIRHDALWRSAGSLSISAGNLTVVYSGAGPACFLRLLTGLRGSGAAHGALRSLRLTARELRFAAAPPKPEPAVGTPEGESLEAADAPQQQQQQQQPTQQQAEAREQAREHQQAGGHACTGAELCQLVQGSEWGAYWDAKLTRSMFREQETLVLTRREPAPPALSPASPAAAPATL